MCRSECVIVIVIVIVIVVIAIVVVVIVLSVLFIPLELSASRSFVASNTLCSHFGLSLSVAAAVMVDASTILVLRNVHST